MIAIGIFAGDVHHGSARIQSQFQIKPGTGIVNNIALLRKSEFLFVANICKKEGRNDPNQHLIKSTQPLSLLTSYYYI
jgi:hypothetical protein